MKRGFFVLVKFVLTFSSYTHPKVKLTAYLGTLTRCYWVALAIHPKVGFCSEVRKYSFRAASLFQTKEKLPKLAELAKKLLFARVNKSRVDPLCLGLELNHQLGRLCNSTHTHNGFLEQAQQQKLFNLVYDLIDNHIN